MELTQLPSDQAALGLVLPIIIAILVQAKMSTAVQSLVALAVCGLATLGTNLAQGDALGSGLGTTIVATFIAYKTFYEPTGIAQGVEDYTMLGNDDE